MHLRILSFSLSCFRLLSSNSSGPSVTHRYLPFSTLASTAHTHRPGRQLPSSIAVFMSVLKTQGPFMHCTSVCFIPPGHRDFVTLPFLSQESHLSLCLPSLISLSAPLHPSNLCSNITSSKKSSLSADPSDMLYHLVICRLTPCFPLKHLSDCENRYV